MGLGTGRIVSARAANRAVLRASKGRLLIPKWEDFNNLPSFGLLPDAAPMLLPEHGTGDSPLSMFVWHVPRRALFRPARSPGGARPRNSALDCVPLSDDSKFLLRAEPRAAAVLIGRLAQLGVRWLR